MVQAVKHLHQHFEGRKEVIKTDLQGLIMKTSFQMFCVAKLTGYNYKIHYKKGNGNSAADALSSMPWHELFQMALHTFSYDLFLEIRKSWEDNMDLRVLRGLICRSKGI